MEKPLYIVTMAYNKSKLPCSLCRIKNLKADNLDYLTTMVHMLDGNSLIELLNRVVKAFDQIESSHKSDISFPKRHIFLYACATCYELPLIVKTMTSLPQYKRNMRTPLPPSPSALQKNLERRRKNKDNYKHK